jgi:uncharacterized damage-inducible protein DinB
MHITELFNYDLWANTQWLRHLRAAGEPELEMRVLQHILAAQEIWLLRFDGSSPSEMPEPALDEAKMREITDGWKRAAAGEDRHVEFRRTTGEAGRRRLSEIAQHVANHGTYHRGELRGLARARGDESFPETDLIAWVGLKAA